MYIQSDDCTPPEHDDVVIWRYMNLPKLLDLLESEELFFARVGMLEDTFEGYSSEGTFRHILGEISRMTGSEPVNSEILRPFLYDWCKSFTFVNCWHMSPHESLAMWKQYGDEGIAIRSTFGRFKRATAKDDRAVYFGKVHYRALEDVHLTTANAVAPLFYKRPSFAYENEARAVVVDQSWGSEDGGDTKDRPVGIRLKVSVPDLVECVYVSPGRPSWYRQLMGRVLARYNHQLPVEASALDERPKFVE